MGESSHIAFDLGAESGRCLLGKVKDGCLSVREISRFPNKMILVSGHLHWNVFELFEQMTKGMASCQGEGVESVGVDTWGVDFALLDRQGNVLGLPFSYRDHRTDGAVESFLTKIPCERLHSLTGLQILWVNTVFQLEAMVRDRSPLLEIASDLLFMPDFFHYLMTGVKKTEFSFATTSQLYNPHTRQWCSEVFEALGLPISLMQEIVPTASVLGRLQGHVSKETGLGDIPVVAVATHDTASAVAAVPAAGDDWAFISSGTWSIVGVLTEKPITNKMTLSGNFSNEGASGGNIRLLKNINALWLLQQCRRSWSPDGSLTYEEIRSLAESAPALRCFVDPDFPGFANPDDMPSAIVDFCRQTSQPAPSTRGEIARCVMESIALKYRAVIDKLRVLHGKPINRVHVVGGGARNELLNQFAADAIGLPILAGPLEATAIGNLLLQAKALGGVASDEDIRQVVMNSFQVAKYEPSGSASWEKAYERFKEIEGSLS